MSTEDLSGVDVLLIRSATRVDRSLLGDHRPRFIATATAGTDHVDVDLLRELGIVFFNAPGSNAISVVEYVLASLSFLADKYQQKLSDLQYGIVGTGHVGGRLAKRLIALGAKVVVSDPPLQEKGIAAPDGSIGYVTYEELLANCDVITFHVPLNRIGDHPTYHMLDVDAVTKLKTDAWVVNAARGSVVSSEAARSMVSRGNKVVLDVWENEPIPDVDLVKSVELATPHIAGYAIDGKLRGTQMVRDSIHASLRLQGESREWGPPDDLSDITGPDREIRVDRLLDPIQWSFLEQLYPIGAEHDAFVSEYTSVSPDRRAEVFTLQRKQYPIRREFATWVVKGEEGLDEATQRGLAQVLGMDVNI